MKMRREAGGHLHRWKIALCGIVSETVVETVFKARSRSFFARRPGFAQTSCPVRLFGEEVPGRERIAFHLRAFFKARGRFQGRGNINLLQRFPERREDLEGLARLGSQHPGLGEKAGVEAFD